MKATIQDGKLYDVTWIASCMREQDWKELSCQLVEGFSRSNAGRVCFEASGDLCWTAWLDDRPVAAFGFSHSHPTLLAAWAFGTHEMGRVMPAISRHCAEFALPLIMTKGYRRCEVRVLVAHDQSYRWLRRMGAKYECTMRYYGRNGEDFALMAWDKDNLPEKYVLAKQKEAA